MKKFTLVAIGVFVLGVVTFAIARAQDVPPPIVTDLGPLERLLKFLEALSASGTVASIGFIVGMAGRFLPFIPNKAVPALATITNIILAAAMVMRKFGEAVTGVSWVDMPWDQGYAMAGIGSFFGNLGLVLGTATWGLLTTAVQRWLWEKAGKQVLVPQSPTLNGGGF